MIRTSLVCSQSNINEKGPFKMGLGGLFGYVWMLCLSRQAWVLSKLVQVIDFLGGLSLLKESTLSMESPPQPLRWADSISHYCKFLPKRLKQLRLIWCMHYVESWSHRTTRLTKKIKPNFTFISHTLKTNREKKKKNYFTCFKCSRSKKLDPLKKNCFALMKCHLWQIWRGWDGREVAHILISQLGRHVSPERTW